MLEPTATTYAALYNDAPAPPGDYYATATIQPAAGETLASDVTDLYIDEQTDDSQEAFVFNDPSSLTIKLGYYDLGGYNELASIPYSCDSPGNGPLDVLLAKNAGTLELRMNGIIIATPAYPAIPATQLVGVAQYNRGVAGATVINNVLATPGPPPPPTLTPFLWDPLTRTPGSDIDTQTAPIGGTWSANNNNLVFQPEGGIAETTFFTFAENSIDPGTPLYWAQIDLIPDPSDGSAPDDQTLYIVDDGTGNQNLSVLYDASATQLIFREQIASVFNTLHTMAYDLVAGADGRARVLIAYDGANLIGKVNGTPIGTWPTALTPTGNFVAIDVTTPSVTTHNRLANLVAALGAPP